jgi:CO/xanthine dehydrogenase FAD-binding subunit
MVSVVFPEDVLDAQERRNQLGPMGAFVGGGTALQLAWGLSSPEMTLLDVTRLPGAQGIAMAGGTLRMGAAVRLETLRRDATVAGHAPLLMAACDAIASLSVRHVATLGGNVAWGFGDTLPVLLALDARVERGDGQGEALVAWLERADASLLLALAIEVAQTPRIAFFEKVGQRAAFSPSRIAIALCAGLDPQERLLAVRVAASGAGLRARRLRCVEQALEGVRVSGVAASRLREACAVDLTDAPALARIAAGVIAGRLQGADHAR